MELEEVLMWMLFLSSCNQFLSSGFKRLKRKRKNAGRRWWVRPILRLRQQQGTYANLFHELKLSDHEQFLKFTRMSVAQFNNLLHLIDPFTKKSSIRAPLPTELRLAATLSFLAHGDSIKTTSWNFRIGLSTMYKILHETTEAIFKALQPGYLKKPNRRDWKNISKGFWEIWNFPHCLGALDGKHVRIAAPPNSGTAFHNYHGYFSMVLMAACDAQYRFTWVDIGDYGSDNDAGIFANTTFGKSLEAGNLDLPHPSSLPDSEIVLPYTFLGDEGFPLKSYLMRPYPRRCVTTEEQKIFNYRLSRARRVIENAFGIVVTRWRILERPLAFTLRNAENVVLAVCCLHNYLMSGHSMPNYINVGYVDQEAPDGHIFPGQWRQHAREGVFHRLGRVGANNANLLALQHRSLLSEYFASEVGAVPWQWQHIY